MLLCHCNVISQAEIEGAIRDLLDEDPWQLIVPAKVFRRLEASGQCCGCIPSISAMITGIVKAYHADLDSAERDVAALMERLTAFVDKQEDKRHARRQRSHRPAQRGSVSRTRRGQPVLAALPADRGLGPDKIGGQGKG